MNCLLTSTKNWAASPLIRISVLFSADKWCLSIIGPFLMDVFLFRVWLHTCNKYYILLVFVATLAQTVWCLVRICRRLRVCLGVLDEPCWSGNPQIRRVQVKLNNGMEFVKASVLFNTVMFGAVVLIWSKDSIPASSSQLQASLDDVEEQYWYSVKMWGMPSSMVYVNFVQFFLAFVPMLSLYLVEKILKRGLAGVSASPPGTNDSVGHVCDAEEVPSSMRFSYSSMGSLDVSSQISELALDVLCLCAFVCIRMCFTLCSNGTYEYYATYMTSMIHILVCERVGFIVCLCAYFVWLRRKTSSHMAQV